MVNCWQKENWKKHFSAAVDLFTDLIFHSLFLSVLLNTSECLLRKSIIFSIYQHKNNMVVTGFCVAGWVRAVNNDRGFCNVKICRWKSLFFRVFYIYIFELIHWPPQQRVFFLLNSALSKLCSLSVHTTSTEQCLTHSLYWCPMKQRCASYLIPTIVPISFVWKINCKDNKI